jgi:hypothetical protein
MTSAFVAGCQPNVVYRVVPFNKLMMPLEENRKLKDGTVEGQ